MPVGDGAKRVTTVIDDFRVIKLNTWANLPRFNTLCYSFARGGRKDATFSVVLIAVHLARAPPVLLRLGHASRGDLVLFHSISSRPVGLVLVSLISGGWCLGQRQFLPRSSGVFVAVLLAFAAALGALAGSAATQRLSHTQIAAPTGPVLVEGWVDGSPTGQTRRAGGAARACD